MVPSALVFFFFFLPSFEALFAAGFLCWSSPIARSDLFLRVRFRPSGVTSYDSDASAVPFFTEEPEASLLVFHMTQSEFFCGNVNDVTELTVFGSPDLRSRICSFVSGISLSFFSFLSFLTSFGSGRTTNMAVELSNVNRPLDAFLIEYSLLLPVSRILSVDRSLPVTEYMIHLPSLDSVR